jgi:metal transporter CNNM
LDKCLGEEVGNILSKNKMKRMFEMYEKDKILTSSERKILSAALEMQEMLSSQVMTSIDDVFMLDIETKIDRPLLRKIYESGYSRIPIY